MMKTMQILNLEQGSQEWLQARAGVITGTRLKDVMAKKWTKARDELIYELIAEKIAPIPEKYKSDAMQRGSVVEDIAKEYYKESVVNVGMIKKHDWLGLSPDGIVADTNTTTNDIRKAVEIKCPEPKAFVRYMIQNKIPDEYKWQVVMYFIVIDTLQELDFIIYNPEIYDENYRMHIINIKRSDLQEEIDKADEALKEFRKEWVEIIKTFTTKTS